MGVASKETYHLFSSNHFFSDSQELTPEEELEQNYQRLANALRTLIKKNRGVISHKESTQQIELLTQRLKALLLDGIDRCIPRAYFYRAINLNLFPDVMDRPKEELLQIAANGGVGEAAHEVIQMKRKTLEDKGNPTCAAYETLLYEAINYLQRGDNYIFVLTEATVIFHKLKRNYQPPNIEGLHEALISIYNESNEAMLKQKLGDKKVLSIKEILVSNGISSAATLSKSP